MATAGTPHRGQPSQHGGLATVSVLRPSGVTPLCPLLALPGSKKGLDEREGGVAVQPVNVIRPALGPFVVALLGYFALRVLVALVRDLPEFRRLDWTELLLLGLIIVLGGSTVLGAAAGLVGRAVSLVSVPSTLDTGRPSPSTSGSGSPCWGVNLQCLGLNLQWPGISRYPPPAPSATSAWRSFGCSGGEGGAASAADASRAAGDRHGAGATARSARHRGPRWCGDAPPGRRRSADSHSRAGPIDPRARPPGAAAGSRTPARRRGVARRACGGS